MFTDRLTRDLYAEICQIPLIDPHSHIDPHAAAARSLDDILGYHYYTELAHSAGMSQEPLEPDTPPRERVRAILGHIDRFDNTVQYRWFLDIARTFLGFKGDRITADDADALFDQAERVMSQPDWEEEVLRQSNVEKVFLTNDFDDPLEGFDTARYVPCLRTDDLVFRLDQPAVRERLAKATGVEAGDSDALRQAIRRLFEHFTAKGAQGVRHLAAARLQPVRGHRHGPRRGDEQPRQHGRFRCRRTPGGGLLAAGRALPGVRPAVRPDDRRQPPRLR